MKRTSKLLSGSVLVLVVATTTLASSPAFAFSLAGVAQAHAACEGDVNRYCASAPSLGQVIACLQQNKQKISKPCQALMSAYGY
jgi:hypothetical protein